MNMTLVAKKASFPEVRTFHKSGAICRRSYDGDIVLEIKNERVR